MKITPFNSRTSYINRVVDDTEKTMAEWSSSPAFSNTADKVNFSKKMPTDASGLIADIFLIMPFAFITSAIKNIFTSK